MNKKRLITIITSVCALVILSGVMALLLWYKPAGDSSSGSSQAPTYPLITADKNSILSISVKNQLDEYKIERLEDGSYLIKKYEGLPIESNSYSYTVSDLANLMALKQLKEISDLSEYGLESPLATVSVEIKDKETVTLKIGNDTPDKRGTYVLVNGKPEVYVIYSNTAKNFLETGLQYISTVIELGLEDTDNPNIERVEVKNAKGETCVILKNPETPENEEVAQAMDPHVMIQPVKIGADYEKFVKLVYNFYGTSAAEVVAANYTPADFEKYGFKKPTASCSITYQGKTTTYTLGAKTDDGGYYLIKSSANLIYRMTAESTGWVDFEPVSVMSTRIVSPYVDSLKTIALNVSGKTYQFALSGEKNNLKVTVNGKAVDTTQFRNFFVLMISSPAEGINSAAVQGSAIMSFKYEFRSAGKSPVSLGFFEGAAQRIQITLDGVPSFETRAGLAVKVAKEIENLINGKTVSTVW